MLENRKFTHAPLFAGINGFGIAAEKLGWEQPFHCEIDSFCQKVIQYYWPKSKAYYDIKQTDFTIWRGKIDVLSGGFPCQPYSQAGKRLGKEDDRHLWPEMLRAIREIQPRWVVGENVSGLLSWNGGLVFEEVQADLENEGYEVQPVILPAAGIGAPHKRDRIWFVAYSTSNRRIREREGVKTKNREQEPGKPRKLERGFKGLCIQRVATNTTIQRSQKWEQSGGWENEEEDRTGLDNRPERYGQGGNATNPCHQGLQRWKQYRTPDKERQVRGEQPSRSTTKLYHTTNWDQFPTQSPVCTRNDGFSRRLDGITFSRWRNESIKAAGNAIVPGVALQIFKVIDQMNKDGWDN